MLPADRNVYFSREIDPAKVNFSFAFALSFCIVFSGKEGGRIKRDQLPVDQIHYYIYGVFHIYD